MWVRGYTLIAGLLLTTTAADKKVNLEDIERDNLRSEERSGSSTVSFQQKSYQVKPETDSEDYRSSSHQYQAIRGLGSYSTAKPLRDYDADSYVQANKANSDYQRQPETANDNGQSYSDYSEQIDVVPKGHSKSNYHQQEPQFYFKPEVTVGNQYQTIQQKAATEKHLHGYKSTVYVPMNQLLAYYSYLSGHGSQSKPLHSLASTTGAGSDGGQQISIPIYTSDHYSRTPIYMPSKLSYNPQLQYITYASQYPSHTQAIIPSKKKASKLYSHVSASSKDLLTGTQSVGAQPQSQYFHQELIYPEQYTATATHQVQQHPHGKSYSSAPIATYSQSNSQPQTSHLEQYYRYITPEQLQYLVSAKTIYHDEQPDYQSLQAPEDGFMPPQLPAKNFKSSYPSASSESTRLHYLQNHLSHSSSSEPKSLLDSYVPSHIIAAQDAERYRERPIKLESGFLPSKINFIHSYKKRKTE
ncbi:uncharacterized protein LOC130669427 isoform X1 [Microplitis mediator]|uniref:uncharacterized protein LOC130669427 isoform X1 n=1 Tax=Microplitis mediator TaxID=375433 RepID=UPI002557131E|nr:uncharacterized protein LOC130669427 isoform X1 [Microplitis mediator]